MAGTRGLCIRPALAVDPDRSSETFDAALRIWDEVMGLSWPKGSRFPGQLTERVAAMTGVDPGRRLALWQEQLRKTAEKLEAQRERYPHVRAIVTERTRVEAQAGDERSAVGRSRLSTLIRISLMTWPCTSVRRRSMPLWRKVSLVWSMPRRCRTVACRS